MQGLQTSHLAHKTNPFIPKYKIQFKRSHSRMLPLKQKHDKTLSGIHSDCLKGPVHGTHRWVGRQVAIDLTSDLGQPTGYKLQYQVLLPPFILPVAFLAHEETFCLDPLYQQYKEFYFNISFLSTSPTVLGCFRLFSVIICVL